MTAEKKATRHNIINIVYGFPLPSFVPSAPVIVKQNSILTCDKPPCAIQNCQIDAKEQQCNQQITFPATAQRDPERDSYEKSNDVSGVRNMRVIAGYATLFRDHDNVVDKVDDRHQTLGSE